MEICSHVGYVLFYTCFDSCLICIKLGTFTSLYKFIINALPILIPAINPRHISKGSSAIEEDDEIDLESQMTSKVPLERRTARMSLSKRAQLVLIRKQTRRWHAALAGAVAGGLAIIWEARRRRGVIAQQMFVRCVYSSNHSF